MTATDDAFFMRLSPTIETPDNEDTRRGAAVQGVDIAFDATGALYLYSSSAQALNTVDLMSGQEMNVGETGDFFTGGILAGYLSSREIRVGAVHGAMTTILGSLPLAFVFIFASSAIGAGGVVGAV
ncbi:DUF5518 domain-containing protein [Haloferax sp. YSMS24]|uniref:DUF5518 domain-containing protein n=1 Tax=Haloferax sp. YSMS24 TaxID=3388425 RepID=UPI00398CB43D